MNFGNTRKSLFFNKMETANAVFYRKCKGFGIFWPCKGPVRIFFCLRMIVYIRLVHRYQDSVAVAGILAQADKMC